MSAETTEAVVDTPQKKGLKKPLFLGLLLAVLGGAGGAGAVMTGLVGGESQASDTGESEVPLAPLGPVAFVPLEPMIVNLPPGSSRDFLSFTATLEVRPDAVAEVTAVTPRIVDVLNTYFRALDPGELADPTFLTRTRGQLLRRVGIVAGEGRVRDILVIEFVLN